MKKYSHYGFYIMLVLAVFFMLSSCKMGRFVYYNFANITDYKVFPYRTAKADSVKFYYPTAKVPKAPKTFTVDHIDKPFNTYLSDNKTVAFLIIQNDSIQYEKYFNGYTQESVVASFSMAKSVTSILIGCAIDDGLIKSVDEPVTNYVADFKHEGFEKITIKDLLQMRSGLKYDESYSNPFGDAATFYYGTNLRKAVYKMQPEKAPGGDNSFSYSSGDTQVLGLVLESALKGKRITAYLEEKLWKPLGMEYDATWSLDSKKNGLEKTFCCINARARDFAKLGRLYLNKGNWNGKQIVSEKWVQESTTTTLEPNIVNYYKYQWWLRRDGSYMAQGILGQYIYVNPKKNLIIVRLGKDYGNTQWPDLFDTLAAHY
jgi:CubicO group peptidase (beta-lactamase class C family)